MMTRRTRTTSTMGVTLMPTMGPPRLDAVLPAMASPLLGGLGRPPAGRRCCARDRRAEQTLLGDDARDRLPGALARLGVGAGELAEHHHAGLDLGDLLLEDVVGDDRGDRDED